MITEFINETLKKFRKKIDKIILYGSAARGAIKKESDIDLLVIWTGKNCFEAIDELGKISYKLLLKYGELISIHPMTPAHYKFLSELNTQFIQNVKKEGVVLA